MVLFRRTDDWGVDDGVFQHQAREIVAMDTLRPFAMRSTASIVGLSLSFHSGLPSKSACGLSLPLVVLFFPQG